MNIDQYLVIAHSPGQWRIKPKARLTTKKPKLASNEIVVKLNIEIPDALFTKPALEASINVPVDTVISNTINADVVSNIQEQIEKTLGVELTINLVEPTYE